jgi:hypothetical protein
LAGFGSIGELVRRSTALRMTIYAYVAISVIMSLQHLSLGAAMILLYWQSEMAAWDDQFRFI